MCKLRGCVSVILDFMLILEMREKNCKNRWPWKLWRSLNNTVDNVWSGTESNEFAAWRRNLQETGIRQIWIGLCQVQASTILGVDSYAKVCLMYELLLGVDSYAKVCLMYELLLGVDSYAKVCLMYEVLLGVDSYAKVCLMYELLLGVDSYA